MATEIKAPYINNLIEVVNDLEDKAILSNQEGTVVDNDLILDNSKLIFDNCSSDEMISGSIEGWHVDKHTYYISLQSNNSKLILSDTPSDNEVDLEFYDGYQDQSYQILHSGNVENFITSKNETQTAVIPANANWIALNDNSFTYNIGIDGITETDNPLIGINPEEGASITTIKSLQNEFSNILRIITYTDSIKIIALKKPSIDIPIQIKIMR